MTSDYVSLTSSPMLGASLEFGGGRKINGSSGVHSRLMRPPFSPRPNLRLTLQLWLVARAQGGLTLGLEALEQGELGAGFTNLGIADRQLCLVAVECIFHLAAC